MKHLKGIKQHITHDIGKEINKIVKSYARVNENMYTLEDARKYSTRYIDWMFYKVHKITELQYKLLSQLINAVEYETKEYGTFTGQSILI